MTAEAPGAAPILGLIFDMDGTLVDNMTVHNQAWEAWHARQNLPFDGDTFFADTAGRTGGEIIGDLLPHLSGEEMLAVQNLKEEIYRELYGPSLEMMPGLERLLDDWQGLGRKMAVATAAPDENAAFVLDGLDIRHRFVGVFSPAMGYRGKPNPDLFLAAAEAMGLEPAHCLVFEDAPLGIEAAARAGMRAVAVTTMLSGDELDAGNVVLATRDFGDPALRTLLGLPDTNSPDSDLPA